MTESTRNDLTGDLLTPAEVADVLEVRESTLAAWRARGQRNRSLPFLKIGRGVKYRAADVREFIERSVRT